jgi:hypothetical protein
MLSDWHFTGRSQRVNKIPLTSATNARVGIKFEFESANLALTRFPASLTFPAELSRNYWAAFFAVHGYQPGGSSGQHLFPIQVARTSSVMSCAITRIYLAVGVSIAIYDFAKT